jgi:hypothetical protein
MQGYVAVELGLDGMEFHMNNEEVSIFLFVPQNETVTITTCADEYELGWGYRLLH